MSVCSFEDGEQFFKSWSAQLRRSADPLCYGSSATAQRSAAPDLCPWSLATGPRIVETEGNVYGEQQLELDLFEPTYAANVDEGQTFVDPRQTLSNIEDIYPLVPDDALNNPYYRSPSGLFQQPPQVQAPSSNVWDCADPRYNQDRMLSCYLSYVSAADPGRVITLEEIQSEKEDAEQNASWITEPQAGQLYETTYFANGEYDHLLAAEAIIGQNASMRSEGNKITSNNASSEKVDKVYVCSLDECKEANPAFLRKSELK